MASRRRGACFLHALAERTALPGGARACTLQLVDLVKSWSGAPGSGVQSLHSDLVAMTASVYIHIKLHFPWDEEVLDAFEKLTGKLQNLYQPYSEGQVVQQEAFLVQQVGFELAILAPSDWVEVCRLRCALQEGIRPRSEVTDSVSWPIVWQ